MCSSAADLVPLQLKTADDKVCPKLFIKISVCERGHNVRLKAANRWTALHKSHGTARKYGSGHGKT